MLENWNQFLSQITSSTYPVYLVDNYKQIDVILAEPIPGTTIIVLNDGDRRVIFYGSPSTGDYVTSLLQKYDLSYHRHSKFDPIYVEKDLE